MGVDSNFMRPGTGEPRFPPQSHSSTTSMTEASLLSHENCTNGQAPSVDGSAYLGEAQQVDFYDTANDLVIAEDPADVEREERELMEEALAFQGAREISLVATAQGDQTGVKQVTMAMEIVLEDGITLTVELDSGERRLIELGYTQTLQRDLTGLEMYSIGLCCVGPFIGIFSYYGLAFANGGPAAVVWYWWFPGIFANFMAMSLAEIASSFPLASSMYFWTAYLSPPKLRPFASWVTGWLEFLGIAIASGSTSLGGVQTISLMAQIGSCKLDEATNTWVPTVEFTPAEEFAGAVVMMIILASINFARSKTLGQILTAAAVYQMLLSFAIIICVPVVAPTAQSPSFVFATHLNNWVGNAPTLAYSVAIAMLFPQYALYSMDSPAHISEEAKRADITTPIAMVGSLLTVTVVQWLMVVSMTFSIQSVDSLSDPTTVTAGGQYFVQILWDAFYARYNSGTGALVIVGLIFVGSAFCSVAQVLTGARVAYALARDKGIPFSSVFSRVDSRKVPIPAIILTCTIGIIAVTPSFFSATAAHSVTCVGVIGWFSAYSFPMFLRIILPEDKFSPGPFYMADYVGVWGGKFIHVLGLLYVLYTIFTNLIPTTFPVTWENFNYSPLITVGILAFITGWWVLDANKRFTGPQIHK